MINSLQSLATRLFTLQIGFSFEQNTYYQYAEGISIIQIKNLYTAACHRKYTKFIN